MKRFIILFLVFIFVLCGCNNQNPNININPDNGYSGYLNSSTDTSTETSTVTSAETTNSSASNTELLNIPEYINKDELANRSYELHFLLGVDKFSSPNELPPNVIVQFAFCHIYYTNLCSMPTTGMKLRETTGNEIEAQISKYFGNISTDITKSDLYNKASQKFKMWEPTYGTKIFYDSTLTKNNEGLYVCTTTFYTNSTKKNIQGKTVLTVEDNGSRAIIKKLSSK
jgi:hypothetical protein